MSLKGRIKTASGILLSVMIVSVAIYCAAARVSKFFDGDRAAVMSAAFTISKGNYCAKVKVNKPEKKKKTDKASVPDDESVETKPASSDFDSSYYNTFSAHKSEQTYPVYTKKLTGGGIKYENFYVKNNTDYKMDIGAELRSELGFSPEKNSDIQVLVYHTHTSESYLDCDVGYYYSDYYPRTSDNRYNVTAVGEEIVKELNRQGIGAVHDKTLHDSTYTGSYYRSCDTVEKYLKKYPSIKVTLDIHRDSIGSDTYKVKPTFTYKGKKGAQIMIMSGYDPFGEYDFPNWNYNLRFALRLQQMCETKFSGMTRPLYFGEFVYNMHINTGSLLIEVGTDGNTLSEARYSGKLLGKALAQVLQNTA